MSHPNFTRPEPNPTSAILHRMTAKADEIEQAPEMFSDEQLDRFRAVALRLSQTAGKHLAKRRGY